MGYELYSRPTNGLQGLPLEKLVEAFNCAGVRCSGQVEDEGQRLLLEGYHSTVHLTIHQGLATRVRFRFSMEDDFELVEMAAAAFKQLGWQVSDGHGEL